MDGEVLRADAVVIVCLFLDQKYWVCARVELKSSIRWFRKGTGKSVDDGARKSKNWLDQSQSGKLGTGSSV